MEKNQNLRTKKQIIYLLVTAIESFPQYNVAQHLSHILRKKEDSTDSYFWKDEKLLSKVESYYEELNQDLLNYKEEKED